MITILWVLVVAAVVALAGAMAGRNGVNAARNRVQMERAFWVAMGCADRAHAAIDATLGDGSSFDDVALRWRTLDRHLRGFPGLVHGDCDVSLEAAGTRLDINVASDTMIDRLLRALGHGEESHEMVDALADWRDTDETARPLGAERSWYSLAGRSIPRNDSLADTRELARVRGFEDLARYDSVVTTEHGRISLATAPVSVLMALPGFTREAAERIVELRDSGEPLHGLMQLPGLLSEVSRLELLAHYSEIARAATVDPDAWVMTVRAHAGFPASRAVLEWRLVRAGRRGAVARTRVIE